MSWTVWCSATRPPSRQAAAPWASRACTVGGERGGGPAALECRLGPAAHELDLHCTAPPLLPCAQPAATLRSFHLVPVIALPPPPPPQPPAPPPPPPLPRPPCRQHLGRGAGGPDQDGSGPTRPWGLPPADGVQPRDQARQQRAQGRLRGGLPGLLPACAAAPARSACGGARLPAPALHARGALRWRPGGRGGAGCRGGVVRAVV
jgi:hypothetical protein